MRICLWLFLVFVAACNGYTTQQTLDADFLVVDKTPVDLLSPANKNILTGNPNFFWTKRDGSLSYLLEISTIADFTRLIISKNLVDSTYSLNSGDLIGITQLDKASYYWRVTTKYSDRAVVSGTAVFHYLEDSIVYADSASVASDQVGNKTSPFKSIQAAIESANTRRGGTTTIAMDIRVAKGTYTESIRLRPGISLRGGYDSNTWNRNISSNVSQIIAPSDIAIRGDSTITTSFTSNTVVEGFYIRGGSTNATNIAIDLIISSPTITGNTIVGSNSSVASTNYGIRTSTSGCSPLITQNNITGGTGVTASTFYGISVASSSSPTISGNTITGGAGTSVNGGIGVSASTAPTISNNTIVGTTNGGSGSTNVGINASAGNPIISGNTISGGTGVGSYYGILNQGGANSTITNNIIFGGQGSGTVYGIYNTVSTATILNNTINGGISGTVLAISMANGATTTIKNNIIFNLNSAGGGFGTCIDEAAAGNDPASVQNNNLFGCTTLYNDSTSGIMNFVCSATGNFHTAAACGGTALASPVAAGNTNITNAGPLFLSINGADGNIATLTDNDWHLNSSVAGNCDVRGGGLTLTPTITLDRDGLLRSTGNPSGGCIPGNVGATGWSIGAYESN